MIKIFVEGKEVVLKSGTDVSIKKQSNNLLLGAENRQMSFTNEFELHQCKQNDDIMQLARMSNSTSDKPYIKLSGTRIESGGSILLDGYGIVREYNKGYKLRVFDNKLDFSDFLKQTSLRDLVPFDNYNFVWDRDRTTLRRTFAYEAIKKVIFPDIDYGRYRFGKTFVDDNEAGDPMVFPMAWFDLFPAVLFKTVLEAIAEMNGLTLGGNLLTDSNFQKSAIIYSLGQPRYSDDFIKDRYVSAQALGELEGPDAAGPDIFYVFPLDSYQDPSNVFTDADSTIYFNYASPDGADQVHTVEYTGGFNITGTWDTTPIDWVPFVNNGFLVLKVAIQSLNQTTMLWENVEASTIFIPFESEQPFTVNINLQGSFRNFGGRKIRFAYASHYVVTGAGTPSAPSIQAGTFQVLADSSYKVNVASEIIPNGLWHIRSNLPDIKCSEFMQFIFSKFNVDYDIDVAGDQLLLNKLDVTLEDYSQAVDWSDKIEMSEQPSVKFGADKFGQRSLFSPNPDDEDIYYNERYGHGVINVNDETLPAEVTVYEAPFASITRNVSFKDDGTNDNNTNGLSNYELAQVPMIEPDSYRGEVLQTDYNPTFNELEPKYALIEEVTVPVDPAYYANQIAIALYIPASSGDILLPNDAVYGGVKIQVRDYPFSESVPEYHNTTIAIMDQAKFFEARVHLTKQDVQNVKSRYPVIVRSRDQQKMLDGVYYLNSIEQFVLDSTDPSIVILAKIK